MALKDMQGLKDAVPFLDDDALRNRLGLLTDLMSVEVGENKDCEHSHGVADDLLVEAVRSLAQYCGRSDAAERLLRYYDDVCKWYA